MSCARFHFCNSNTNSNSNTVNWFIHCMHKFSGIIFAIGSKHFCQFRRTNRVVLLWRTSTLLQRILHHRLMLPMLPESLLDDFATFDFVFNTTWPCDPAEMQLELLWTCKCCSWTLLTSSPPSSRPRTCSPPYYLLGLAHSHLHSAALLSWTWRRGVGSPQHPRCSDRGQCFSF